MRPTPEEIPLKASEAATLADAVFQRMEGKPVDDEAREELARGESELGLEGIRPCWGSLGRDPDLASTYYLAVDALREGDGYPYLLRFALASGAASELFPEAKLVGRMRPGGGREVGIEAIPFSYEDREAVLRFAGKVERAFLPRPQGAGSAIAAGGELQAAFEAFRRVQRATGRNLAAVEGGYEEAVWAAVRTGWREGYSSCGGRIAIAGPHDEEAAREAIRAGIGHTRFRVDASELPREESLRLHAEMFAYIRELKRGEDFGYEVDTAEPGLREYLEELRTRGCAARIVRAEPGTLDGTDWTAGFDWHEGIGTVGGTWLCRVREAGEIERAAAELLGLGE